MVEVKIRSIWQGKIGVHEKYVNQALEQQKGLLLIKGTDSMEIQNEEVKEKIVGKTEEPFRDKFTNNLYHLFYFDWKPNNLKQASLL